VSIGFMGEVVKLSETNRWLPGPSRCSQLCYNDIYIYIYIHTYILSFLSSSAQLGRLNSNCQTLALCCSNAL
jgi:hypothetical protein